MSNKSSSRILVLDNSDLIVGTNTQQESSAKLETNSETQDFLAPRMSDAQRADGGFCEIGIQIINAIEQLGYEVEISETGNEQCQKGSTSIVGYFITSEVQVLSVRANDCLGGIPKDLPFEHLACN
jgi:hypothetical protein